MVDLGGVVKQITEQAGNRLAQQGVEAARAFAPHDGGGLAASIHYTKAGQYTWVVETGANGPNGFAYPARIELGQEVHPRPGNTRGLYYHGTWHKMSGASAQSGFMRKAMATLHI